MAHFSGCGKEFKCLALGAFRNTLDFVKRLVCKVAPDEKTWGVKFDPPGSSIVAFLYRGRQCGFNTKHQSTKEYWKGEVFAYVGSIQNLKDLKGPRKNAGPVYGRAKCLPMLGAFKTSKT